MQHLVRRDVIKGLALGAVCAPHVARGAALDDVTSIRSVPLAWTYAFEDFAIAMKFFEMENLHVEPRPTGKAPNNDALLSDAGTLVISPADQVLRAQLQRLPIKIIAGAVNRFASPIIVKDEILRDRGVTDASPIQKKIDCMKGLRFGTTGPGGAPDLLIRYLLVTNGVDPERECRLVPMRGGGAAMLASFKQGQIDGFCLSSPTPEIAMQSYGGQYLFNMCGNPPPFFDNFLYQSIAVTTKTARDKPDLLVRYCKGVARSLRAINTDVDKFKAWAKEFYAGFPPGTFEQSFPDNSRIFLKDPICTATHFERALDLVVKTASSDTPIEVPRGFSFEETFDNSFARKAVAAI